MKVSLVRLFSQQLASRFILRAVMACDGRITESNLVRAVNSLLLRSGKHTLPPAAIAKVARILASSGILRSMEGEFYCMTKTGLTLFGMLQTQPDFG